MGELLSVVCDGASESPVEYVSIFGVSDEAARAAANIIDKIFLLFIVITSQVLFLSLYPDNTG